MVNLVPAKCPSCGATLKLDDNMKKAECEFCKTTIIVDEAIQKYQFELKGKVKVSNDYSDKIETAKKYIKLKKNDDAKRIINDILKVDELNLEALKMNFELNIEDIYNKFENLETESEILELDSSKINDVENLISEINKISTLDDNHDFIDFTNEHSKRINEKMDSINKYYQKKQELIDKCNTFIYNPTFKCNRLIKVLETLKFDKRRIRKDFDILKCYNNQKVFYISNGIKVHSPQISNIGYNTAIINCTAKLNNYKQTRKEYISLDEQIELIDKLIENENKSLFGKFFCK